MSSRFDQQPKWINPCGLTTLKSAHPNLPHESPNSTPDSEMFQPIITQAEIALDKANKIKDQFVTTTFQRSFDEINNWFSNSFEDEHYDEWLPKFPKKIGENVPESILRDMEVDNALLEAYTNLQMVALGLEQVVWDQIDRDGQFKAALGEAEHNLRSVLCELQMTISERNLQMKEDVTREHMSGEFRKMDVTKTKQRDFIIFREYINALEYVIKVFDYLQNRKID